MVRAQTQTLIGRPTDSVYGFVAEDFFANYPRWSPEVVELQRMSTGPVRLGTTGRQVRIDQGRRTESTFRVTRFERGRCVVFQGISSPFLITYSLEPVGNHTRLTFTFELSRLELYMRPFEKLIRYAIQDGTQRVARNLKALIEAEIPSVETKAQQPAT